MADEKQLSDLIAPTKPEESPIAYEEKELPSYTMDENYNEKAQTGLIKHIAGKLREDYPDLKDASDDETYQAIKKVELSDASPDEAWQALVKVYGNSYQAPQPPLVSVTEPSVLGSMAADFLMSNWQDISAIPKGFSEMIQGVGKVAGGQLQGVKNTAFGAYQAQPKEIQEGADLIERGGAHLKRGGAFALGLLATEGMSETLKGVEVLNRARKFFPRMLQNATKGALDVGTFMGTYEGIRETEKAGATPEQVLHAFMEGATSGAKFGATLGAGATVGGTLLAAARSAGVAAKEAKTFAQSKAAAAKFANIFDPRWGVDATDPAAFADEFITKMYGSDVAKSPQGKRSIEVIARRIKEHQDNIVKTAFVEKPLEEKLPATGFAENESPEAFASKRQLITPRGPAWNVVIETSPGVKEVHNVFAKTQDEATQLANQKAGELDGTLSKVEPQFERRAEDRRTENVPQEVERRQAERRTLQPSQLENLQQIVSKARTDLATIESASGPELIQKFQEKFPDKTVPGDTEEIRTFFRNQAQAELQGVEQLRSTAEMEAPRLQLELATPAEVTKALVNPNFKEEFERLRANGASDEEIMNIVQRSLKDRYGPVSSDLASEGGKVYGGFDKSLIKKLAAKMYKGELSTIVPKELLQNAIDSVRGKEGGKIDVDISHSQRAIKVKDNGSGMSPDVVKKQLVDLGSSLKPEGSSGGFGLAKAALFANAKDIHVVTVAEVGGKKIETVLQGSGDDWADSEKGLFFKTREVPKDTPTGTSIQLKFPKKDADGNPILWDRYTLTRFGDKFRRYNFSGIPVSMKMDGIDLHMRNYVESWEPLPKVDTPGASLKIYTSGKPKEQTYIDVQILNRGIPQFEISYPFFNQALVAPEKIVVDVNSKVAPDNALYPFTTNREEVTPSIHKAILDKIMKIATEANKKQVDVFKRVLVDSPNIGAWKLIDPTESRPPEMMKEILTTPEYEPFLGKIHNGLIKMQEILKKHDKIYEKLKLHGLSTNQEHLGSNVRGDVTINSPYNLMLINPWTTMDEVLERVNKKITGEDLESVADDFAWQIIHTTIHELTHQVARGHDVAFAGKQTRNEAYLSNVSNKIYQDLMEGLRENGYKLVKQITKHSVSLLRDSVQREGKNILETVSDASSANGSNRYNQKLPENGPKGRTKSSKTVPSSGGNPVKGISPSTKGRGNLSTIIERAREIHKIPSKTPEEAQINPQDYIPVQEIGREEIPVD